MKGHAVEAWVCADRGKIEKDTGYSINNADNGLWLPSIPEKLKGGLWGPLSYEEKKRISFAVMEAGKGQFHKGPHDITDPEDPFGEYHKSYKDELIRLLNDLNSHIHAWASRCFACEGVDLEKGPFFRIGKCTTNSMGSQEQLPRNCWPHHAVGSISFPRSRETITSHTANINQSRLPRLRMYYRIKANIYDDFGVETEPELPLGLFLHQGQFVRDDDITEPLPFSVNCTAQEPPRHFMGISIPVVSPELLELLQDAGVDNLQTFSAMLRNDHTGETWSHHQAINIIGLISCADLNKSEYTSISSGPGDSPPLVKFHRLVIDPAAAHGHLLFRLAESPSTILVLDKVMDRLRESRPEPAGWGISSFPVDEA